MGIARMLILVLLSGFLVAYTPAERSPDPVAEQNELAVTMVGNAGTNRVCGEVEILPQGTSSRIAAAS